MNRLQKENIRHGSAVIIKAGLSSQKQIEAQNLWRAVVFLSEKLHQSSMRIYEVGPEDIVDWI